MRKGSGTAQQIKVRKKVLNQCNRHKAMYGLEYSSLILDVMLGFVCLILGLLHYYNVAKPFEKITGIIGVATGIIGFFLNSVYIYYSWYIFINEIAPDSYDDGLNRPRFFTTVSRYPLMKLNGDGAFAEKYGNEYKCLYYKKDKDNSILAKYSDLGKKQYNYEKKRHYPEDNDEFKYCVVDVDDAYNLCKNSEKFSLSDLTHFWTRDCKYIYLSRKANGFGNKYLFDRWVTTIIFSCFIIACCIGLAIFGLLLFISDGSGLKAFTIK